MPLLDDDFEIASSPDPDEQALTSRLGDDGLRAVDAALVRHARSDWSKVARVVLDAVQAGGFAVEDDVVALHVRRVIALVDSGRLQARGNLRRPRFSEVRLDDESGRE